MPRDGIIEPANSPWRSRVVLVPKKDGKWRFCVDYRGLNEVTKHDSHPIPHIQDLVQKCAGNKWYCTLDLRSGYWQIQMAETDKEKTAFAVPDGGLWQFRVMPFGLTNAVATFQRAMERVLKSVLGDGVFVYIDDVIIMGSSVDETLSRLRDVLKILADNNLVVNPNKCVWFDTSIKYLGHLLSFEGIATDKSKVEAVQSWEVPNCRQNLRVFIGLASYYRRFVKYFALIAKSLFNLTREKVSFSMSKEAISAFSTLKSALTMTPILTSPNFAQPFILDVDASSEGVGAVLSQIRDGKEVVIEYYNST